ncbi:MAG: fatty acid desaturase family protein [Planctomycetaceae bacterium]
MQPAAMPPEAALRGTEGLDDPARDDAAPAWVSEVRQALRSAPFDPFRVKPWRYWTDFLLSLVIAYSAATAYLLAPLGSWWQVAAFPVAAFWLYRLGSLVHEVCHLGAHEMRGFKVAWNVLVGTFTLTPSPFFTRQHRDHHSLRMYGTPEDPEYVANVMQGGDPASIAGYVAFMLAFPILVFLRFLLAPLTFLHPRLRETVLERASSLTLNTRYRRRLTPADRRSILGVEALCFLRAAAIPFTIGLGVAPWTRVPLLYLLALATFLMNQSRQLADHHFSGDGTPASVEDHILDSCNHTGADALTLLFFPFAIRFHALHHLFPSLPYHNLAATHAFLVRTLPAGNPYLGLDQPGWWPVAKRTVRGPATAGAA